MHGNKLSMRIEATKVYIPLSDAKLPLLSERNPFRSSITDPRCLVILDKF